MTRRSTRVVARYALLALAGMIAVFGGRQVVTGGADLRPSSPAAVLTSAALHGPQAVADRPSSPVSPVTFGVLLLSTVGLALALVACWVAIELTDHRTWAIAVSLRSRRRGPPARFTV